MGEHGKHRELVRPTVRPEEPSRLPERALWAFAVLVTVAFAWLFVGMANAFGFERTSPMLLVLIPFYLLMSVLGWLARRRRVGMAKRLSEYHSLMARIAASAD